MTETIINLLLLPEVTIAVQMDMLKGQARYYRVLFQGPGVSLVLVLPASFAKFLRDNLVKEISSIEVPN